MISYICRRIITNWIFEFICLFVILFNSVVLALDDPTTDVNTPIQDIIDDVLLYLYTTEMSIKIIGMGFIFQKYAYLRDSWNILDFAIVFTAWLPRIIGGQNNGLSSLRVLRVLRPLRTISSIKSLRVILTSLFSAIRLLLDSLIVLLFFFLIFAIAGLQLFMGMLKRRCFDRFTGIPVSTQFCSSNDQCTYLNTSDKQFICGKMIENANYGLINFDTIGWSVLQVFQCVTMEGWSTTMIMIQESFSYYTFIYFILLIFIGTFFLMNLNLAIIRTKFDEASKEVSIPGKPVETLPEQKLHDLKKFLEWGLYVSSKQKYYQQQQKSIESLNYQSMNGLIEEYKKVEKLVDHGGGEIVVLDNESKYNQFFQTKKEQKQYEPQLDKIESLKKARLSMGGSNPSSTKHQIALLSQSSFESISPKSNILQERKSPLFGLSPKKVEFKSRFVSKVIPINSSIQKIPIILNSIKEENHKKIMNRDKKSNFIEKNQKIKTIIGKELKMHLNTDSSNTREIRFAGMLEIQQKQQKQQYKKEGSSNQSLSKNSNSSFSSSSDDQMDIEEEFMQELKINQRKKQMSQLQINSNLSNNVDIFGLKSQKIQQKQQEMKKDNLILSPSSSSKSQKSKKQFSQSSENDSSSFDINDPNKKNNKMMEDEDFREQMIESNLFSLAIQKTLGIIDTPIKKIANKRYKQQQNRRRTMLKRRETIQMEKNPHMFPDLKQNDVNIVDEQEIIDKYKMLYNKKKMIARVAFDQENYKLDDDEMEIPHDSINEVLPSLKMKAAIKLQQESHFKLINKKFKINFTFNEKKIIKKVEANIPQTKFKQQQKQKQKRTLNFISLKKKDFNKLNPQNRFREVFDIRTQENLTSDLNPDLEELYNTKFNPQKFNVLHQINYFCPESLILQKIKSETVGQSLTTLKKKYKAIKKAKQNIHRLQIQYPSDLTDIREKFYPTNAFSLRDYENQQQQKKKKIHEHKDKNMQNGMENFLKDHQQEKDKDEHPNLLEIPEETKQKETVKKDQNADEFDDETDIEEVPKEMNSEYYWRIQRTIDLVEDEVGLTQVKVPWSGEEVMQQINPQYFLYDWKSIVHFNQILGAINWTIQDYEMWEGGLIGLYQSLRRQVKKFALGQWFDTFIMLSVLGNTIILALDGLVSQKGSDTLQKFNLAFTYIFTIDMTLKMFGMGVSEYLKDKMNIFDCIIVSLSLFELFIFGNGGSAISAFRSVRIFRIFRVLRMTRLIRELQYMQVIMDVVSKAIEDFMYIFLLLILFNYIYALLGMQIFGGKFNFDDPPRMTFDDFFAAYMTVFDLLTIENWNDILTSTLRTDVNYAISLLYLISWIFMGNYVLLNLFLAILLNGFDETDNKILENEFYVSPDSNNDIVENNFIKQKLNPIVQQLQVLQKHDRKQDDRLIKQIAISKLEQDNQVQLDLNDEEEDNKEKKKKLKKKIIWFDGIECQNAWFIFSQYNIVRKSAYWVVKHEYFETIILIAIVISSLKLIVDSYLNPDDPNQSNIIEVSLIIDEFFTFFFTFEMCLKSMALGFFWDKNSYLRESWSQLDFFIVCASLVDFSLVNVNLQFVKILRLLRTLRPLRFISHNKNMKTVVTALLESVSGILNVLIVVILIWIMFGIFGMSLMMGKVHYCELPPSDLIGGYYGVGYKDCIRREGQWLNKDMNFDDIFQSIITLFVLSTVEGWPNYVFNFVDADKIANDGENLGPDQNSNRLFMLYFLVFLFIGSMFLMNLFIGVVQLNYHLADKAAKSKFLSEQQTQWIEVQQLILESKPDYASIKPPENYFRQKIWYFCQGPILETLVMTCIILNIVTMGMGYETSPADYDYYIKQINLGFTSVFMAECALKLFGYGFFGYFYSGWNRFDFFVVCTSIIDIILEQMDVGKISFLKVGPQLGRIFRVLRVSRLLRLVKQFQGLQKLIQVAVYALPALMNVTALLLLAFFIFSILGVFLFGSITQGDQIDQNQNFNDFHHALLLLFQCSTGENWYLVMFDTRKQVSGYSVWFFIFFVVLVQIIMINLFILIILSQFEENFINEDNALNKFQEREQEFKQDWVRYTRNQNGIKLHEKYLVDFFFDLKEPLGIEGNQKLKDYIEQCREKKEIDSLTENQIKKQMISKLKRQVAKMLMKMCIIPDQDGYLYYNELLFYFYKNYMQDNIDKIDPSKEDVKEKALQILSEEQKITKRKLNRLKQSQNMSFQPRTNQNPTNPMERILFINMCIKTWLNYTIVFLEKQLKQQQNQVFEHYFSSSSSSDNSDNSEKQSKKAVNIIERSRIDVFDSPDRKKNKFQLQNYCKIPDTSIYSQEFIEDLKNPIEIDDSPKKNMKRKSSILNQLGMFKSQIVKVPSSQQNHENENHDQNLNHDPDPDPIIENQNHEQIRYQPNIINLNIQNNFIINNNFYFDGAQDQTTDLDLVSGVKNIHFKGANNINIQNIIQETSNVITPQQRTPNVRTPKVKTPNIQ